MYELGPVIHRYTDTPPNQYKISESYLIRPMYYVPRLHLTHHRPVRHTPLDPKSNQRMLEDSPSEALV